MKLNTRKANLDPIDTTSMLRPLYGVHYDNFALPLTTPTEIEPTDYSPASDFLVNNNNYEFIDRAYVQTFMSPDSVELITGKSKLFKSWLFGTKLGYRHGHPLLRHHFVHYGP